MRDMRGNGPEAIEARWTAKAANALVVDDVGGPRSYTGSLSAILIRKLAAKRSRQP
jgi:hypothetical protein